MNKIDIGTLRFETERQLDELTQRRGAHLLDGIEFDDSEVERLQQKLAGLTAASGEQARRQRVDAAAERSKRRVRLADELLGLERRRLEAVADAAKATRQLVASLTRLQDVSGSMQKSCKKGDFKIPLNLNESATAVRISALMAAAFTRLAGPGSRYGSFRWFYSGRHKAADDWAAIEEKMMVSQLNESIKDIDDGTSSN